MRSSPTPPPGADPPAFAAGPVTGARGEQGAWPAPEPEDARRRAALTRRAAFWYGGAAVAALVIGLIVVLVVVLGGQFSSGRHPSSVGATPDRGPPLARLCPPPDTPEQSPSRQAPAAPAGPRTVDKTAGISYPAYGPPWEPWPLLWTAGTLNVAYGVGQHFITESYGAGDYHASILSAAVPATVNDSMAIDVECVGRQVVADVRAEYYPQPNQMHVIRAGRTVLGGRPAWVTKFRLSFSEEGLAAKSELVGVALIDVGRPTAAVLYVSIPDTHRQWEHVVDEVLDSVLPT